MAGLAADEEASILKVLRWLYARSDEMVLALLAVLLFVVASNTQTGWLYVISSALGACLAVGWWGPRRHLKGLRLHVVLPPLGEQNTLVLAELDVQGPRRRQVQVVVPRQPWEHPGPDRVLLLDEVPGCLELPLQPRVRGAHRLEGLRLRSRAPFGMFPHEVRQAPEQRPLLVYPQGPLLPGLALGKARERPSPSGRTSRRAGSSHDLRRLRPYQLGEDIRYVHWPTTARGQEVMVREFQDPGGQSLCLVLDNRRETGEYPHTSLEEAIRAAASLLVYAHRRQIPLTLCSLQDGWVRLSSPRLEQSRRLLAEIKLEEGRLRLDPELQGGQEVIVLTSSPDDIPVRAERMTVVDFSTGLRAEQIAGRLS